MANFPPESMSASKQAGLHAIESECSAWECCSVRVRQQLSSRNSERILGHLRLPGCQQGSLLACQQADLAVRLALGRSHIMACATGWALKCFQSVIDGAVETGVTAEITLTRGDTGKRNIFHREATHRIAGK